MGVQESSSNTSESDNAGVKKENNGNKEEDQEKEKSYYGYDLYPDRRRTDDCSGVMKYIFQFRGIADEKKRLCEVEVIKALKRNPMVRTLVNALQTSGCPFDIRRHVTCEECDKRVTGGYDPEWNQIVICQNSFKAYKMCYVTLIHELIHMYDYCVNKIDFKNLHHLACTEIRAANLTHCSFLSSFALRQSSLINIKNTHQYCVKMKAIQSLMVARNLDFDTAHKYVYEVFDKCYRDLEPIGRKVRRNSTDPLLVYKDGIHFGYGNKTPDDT